MLRKRTAGAGVSGPTGPVRTAAERAGPARLADHADTALAVALKLALEHRRIAHRPTVAQLRNDGRLSRAGAEHLPARRGGQLAAEALPVRFPHGADGLCFTHPGGEVAMLPDGCGFALG